MKRFVTSPYAEIFSLVSEISGMMISSSPVEKVLRRPRFPGLSASGSSYVTTAGSGIIGITGGSKIGGVSGGGLDVRRSSMSLEVAMVGVLFTGC